MNGNVTTNENISQGIRQDGTIVEVDLTKCIAAGPCAIVSPEVFEIRMEDGKAIIKNPDGDTIEKITEAARSCPILAISIKKQTGENIFP